MSAAKFRAVSPTAAKRTAARGVAARKAKAAEEAAMMREAEALLAKINRGLDEAIAHADRMLARYE